MVEKSRIDSGEDKVRAKEVDPGKESEFWKMMEDSSRERQVLTEDEDTLNQEMEGDLESAADIAKSESDGPTLVDLGDGTYIEKSNEKTVDTKKGGVVKASVAVGKKGAFFGGVVGAAFFAGIWTSLKDELKRWGKIFPEVGKYFTSDKKDKKKK